MDSLAPVLILVTIFTAIVLMVRTVTVNRRLHQIAKLQSDMQTHFLSKSWGLLDGREPRVEL